jgi:membrane-bound lytic murein transglycosylase F
MDPNTWFGDVESALLKLQEPRCAPKARHGWCRGEEPVQYVAQIQARYDEWVRL